jgi:hypothetical protein
MKGIGTRHWLHGLAALAIVGWAAVGASAQQGQGPCGMGGMQGGMMCGGGMQRGMMRDPAYAADMQGFHQLIAHRTEITRTVMVRPDGVETLTESDNPEAARLIQAHVAAMLARVKERRPIHQRDPLFREIFANADKIAAQSEATAKGMRVVETSTDPYVARLIQAHAEVVSAFLANGHAEMMKNHEVPAR